MIHRRPLEKKCRHWQTMTDVWPRRQPVGATHVDITFSFSSYAPIAMPQPLPSNPYNHDQPGWRDAYDVCLRLEGATSMPKLVFVRFIGYMILEAPSNEARDAVSREINSYADDVALLDLAEFLTYNLLRFCTSPLIHEYIFFLLTLCVLS
jgi:hypothetical protein